MPDILSVNILFLFEKVFFSLTFEGHFHGMLTLFSSLHCCLVCMVSDKSAVILSCSSIVNLSFCLWFPLITLYLLRCGFLFFIFMLLGILWASCICDLLSVTNFESSQPLFLQIIIVPSSFFSSFWGSNYKYVILFDIAPQFLNAVFYFFLFCLFSFLFLLTWSGHLICMFTYSFFVYVSSAVEHGVILLLLSISIWFLITVNTSLVKLSICSCILSTFSIKSF